MKNLNVEKNSDESGIKSKKFKFWQIVLVCILAMAIVNAFSEGDEENSEDLSKVRKLNENIVLVCDGVNITEDCKLNGKEYILYKYYPAIEEKSHIERVTKYKKEIVGYCTLCNDGTYSTSCATGRGACSHHSGVAQWNAPIYNQVPYYEEIKTIDSPAVAERYEIIEKN